MMHRLRIAARGLFRTPGFTIVAVATIGLGIGSTAVAFSLVDAAFLHELPYHRADRLVVLSTTRRGEELSNSFPDFEDWRARNHTFGDMAAFVGTTASLTSGSGDAEVVRGLIATPNLFHLLGAHVAFGRDFSNAEGSWGSPRVVILSDGLWKRRFGADPTLVGRSIMLDREPWEVVGIMPAGFDFPGGIVYDAAEVWMPSGTADASDWRNRRSHPGIVVLARLRDRVTMSAARQDMDAIAAQLRAEYPADDKGLGVQVRGALEAMVGNLVPGLLLVGVASALLLAIISANLAALLLARSLARRRDLVIRISLGAARADLMAYLLLESAVLGLLGGAFGVAFAWGGIRAIRPLLAHLPRAAQAHIDWRVVVFAFTLSSITSVCFGIGPALAASRDARIGTWRAAGARQVLVAAEIAVALIMVVAATTLGRSFVNMLRDHGGIDPSGVLTMELRLPPAVYADSARVVAFYRELRDRFAALPGVTSVGGISTLPFSGGGSQQGIQALDQPGDEVRTDVAVVTPGYFSAIGAWVVSGRDIRASDDSRSMPVAVVDERFAERFWPNEANVIGKQVRGWGFPVLTIVGVIHHVANYGVTAPSRQELFVPHAQRATSRMVMELRTAGDPIALARSARAVVRAMDPQLPLYNLRTMRAVVAATIAAPRLATFLSGSVAFMALVLAAVGLYGLLAYTVGQRTREIGVRMALGATPQGIVGLVLQEVGLLVAVGIAAGVSIAAGAVRLLQSQLFGVVPLDPFTFAVVPVLFVAVAFVATVVPAMRAARISPMRALADQ
jgi:putative ABC transport system permease protein